MLAKFEDRTLDEDLQVNGTKDDLFNPDNLERDVEEAFDAVQEGEEEDGASQAHRSKKSKKVKKKVKKRKDKKQE
jgi:hypothetical protein